MSENIPLTKMNGIGNKILIADMRESTGKINATTFARLANDTKTTFDQLMTIHQPRENVSADVEIFNRDGSPAQACGNGMRCLALLFSRLTDQRQFAFQTAGGIIDTYIDDSICAIMGEPRFAWQEIPLNEKFAEKFSDTHSIELQIDNSDLHSPSVVNIGNPHAVFWVDDIDAHDLARFGPLLEHHPLFPQRANITLAQVITKNNIKIKTWERGAGLTLACGSAACATLVCGNRTQRCDSSAQIILPGGELHISWQDNNKIKMCGRAEYEFSATLNNNNGTWQYD